jgi:RNA polymerase sigma-70 factor (ECF subfamily)
MNNKKLEATIEGCKKRNRKSQKALFEMFYGKALGICMRYIRDKDTAQDIAQIGFIKLYKNIDSYAHEGNFEGWMRRFFVNSSIDYIRKNKNRFMIEDSENIKDEDSYDLELDEVSRIPSEQIVDAVRELPDGYRAVFNLYAVEGYTHSEISKILEISEGTSKSNYHRAKKALSEKLSHLKCLN